jgi:hypothetical protein
MLVLGNATVCIIDNDAFGPQNVNFMSRHAALRPERWLYLIGLLLHKVPARWMMSSMNLAIVLYIKKLRND